MEQLSRFAAGIACLLVATLIALGGIGVLCAALYLALDREMSAPSAALVTGAVLLGGAGLLAFIGRQVLRRRPPRRVGTIRSQTAAAGGDESPEVAAELGRLSAQFVRSHARGSVLSAFATGFAVGASPSLRRRLRDLFR